MIVVVGGSLAGLTLALACARHGVGVRVIERAAHRVQGGDSLSVDLAAIAATTGHDPLAAPALPVVPAYRDRHLVAWPALYDWLRDRAAATPGIHLDDGRNVTSIAQDGAQVRLGFADGTGLVADAVIGADGYRSIVRGAIDPAAPLARYAGYLVWRGLVDESVLAHPVDWPSDGGLWIELAAGYRLVAAVLRGRDGALRPGLRQITFAWFDVHRAALLRERGLLTPEDELTGTLARGAIDAVLRAELAALVPRVWPARWAPAVTAGLASAGLSGAPIAEYKPAHLARGALAIVGDAAHVMSPMTGSGYATAVDDAAILARLLAGADTPATALAQYEAARLPYVRAMADHSARLSAAYRRIAARG